MTARSYLLGRESSGYADLKRRLAQGSVLLLDGAVGTELQALGVPIGPTAWAAVALDSHPDTVRFLHESYIRAGVDIITTNTYSAARHCFEPLGMGHLTRELNLRAVELVMRARDRVAGNQAVYVAGSVSNFGMMAGGEELPEKLDGKWGDYTETALRRNLHEQAQILVDGGVDFLLVESTGSVKQRQWVLEACLATGHPTWLGTKCRLESGGVFGGYQENLRYEEGLEEVLPKGADLVSIFHSTVEATSAAIPLLREKWNGPIAVYPDAARQDYVDRQQNAQETTHTSPDEFVDLAKEWVAAGAQVIGGCCGFGLDYIRPLREALPEKLSQ
ncbi:MAG: homocysteine S-methyltransferase family protein [Pseudomonadota bacterium]